MCVCVCCVVGLLAVCVCVACICVIVVSSSSVYILYKLTLSEISTSLCMMTTTNQQTIRENGWLVLIIVCVCDDVCASDDVRSQKSTLHFQQLACVKRERESSKICPF